MDKTQLQGLKVMSPGPTQINKTVLNALSEAYTNPDLDPKFVVYYKETCDYFNRMIQNDGETFLLTGEGILGLEAACASFIEEGDRVLTISNGIFGKGFEDFSKLYGAKTALFEGDPRQGIDLEALEMFILNQGPFKLATVVHCETPSGLTNPIKEIGRLLRKYNILSVVDSVSAIGGEEMDMASWELDVVLCASQKAISAPVGLTTVSLSKRALQVLKERQSPVRGFYNNLKLWLDYEEKQWFAYTQPIHLVVAFRTALEQMELETSLKNHKALAEAVRLSFTKAGLTLFAKSHYANTVTTVMLPEGLDFSKLQDRLKTVHKTLIGGGFDFLENKIFRIGHMGQNATFEDLYDLLVALDECFNAFEVPLEASLSTSFEALMR